MASEPYLASEGRFCCQGFYGPMNGDMIADVEINMEANIEFVSYFL